MWSKMRVCSELAKLGDKTTTKTGLQQRLQLFVNSKAAELVAVQTETHVIWIPKDKQMGGEMDDAAYHLRRQCWLEQEVVDSMKAFIPITSILTLPRL